MVPDQQETTPKTALDGKQDSSPLPLWAPRPGKYLVASCHLGTWTKRLRCVERALVLSVMLNRTLIVPHCNVCAKCKAFDGVDPLIDMEHLRQCLDLELLIKPTEDSLESLHGEVPTGAPWVHVRFASQGVITLSEYLSGFGKDSLNVDMLMCKGTQCPPANCNLGGKLVYPNATEPPVELYDRHKPVTAEDLSTLVGATKREGVLSVGDTLFTSVKGHLVPKRDSLSTLFRTMCGAPFQPAKEVFNLAAEVQVKDLTDGYGALHFPRAEYERYCVDNKIPYWSADQVAKCVSEEMTKLGLDQLFVSTDANSTEIKKLRRLLGTQNIALKLYRQGPQQSKLVRALVDKVVSAQATVFFHEEKEAFGEDILQLRHGLGTNSSFDRVVCYGKDPEFKPSFLKASTE